MGVCCQSSRNVCLGFVPWGVVWFNVAWLPFAAPKEPTLKETIIQKPQSASRTGGTRSNCTNPSQFTNQFWAYFNDGWGQRSLHYTLALELWASKDGRFGALSASHAPLVSCFVDLHLIISFKGTCRRDLRGWLSNISPSAERTYQF